MTTVYTLTMNPAIDKSSHAERVVPEKKIRCETPRFDPGGGGINVSRVVKELGGETKAFYPAGGVFGRFMENLLDAEGIDQKTVSIKNMTRVNIHISEDSTDNQYRFGMPGPEMFEEEWNRCLEILFSETDGVEYLVASGSLPPGVPDDFLRKVAEKAREKNIRLIVDTSGEPLKKSAGAGVYLLKPNMNELADLAGREIGDEEDQEKAVEEILDDNKSEIVVLSLGAGGVYYSDGKNSDRLRSPSVPIRSRIGAGDSMVAGIVMKLASGAEVHDAVLYGIAAGTAAVMTPGTELCHREDVERLYEKMKRESA